ncbi:MAG: hypothetical protein PWQ75_1438 [Methanolobus sp.]|jgi:hypothetical protein|uniref:Uncharacterized protein n=1 Tax=Methanolobus tindarius DSM 2278 TaxID=1090322 RepID=W9DRU5_METTI|nr:MULTISPECIES: hypothetical protein [Methanolobus]ETA68488.1 hypothetical protein MettiDRAFT_1960 [Methanolobus tindarius DSM 2278]MDI3486768.1 hypothetical protein [Methanolobus sp.]MDK2831686.1 hypothetical protein [Methanolobus sp.]
MASEVSLSWIPIVKKRTVIRSFLVAGWTIIAAISATIYGFVDYESIKYVFWIAPLMLPVLIVLFSRSSPPVLNKRDEDKTILALTTTFTCLVLVLVAGIL